MKKLSLIFISVLLVFTLVACGNKCEHTYDNICDATCNECGEIREVGAHDYTAADCDTAKICKNCGATEGEALGHEWTTPDVDQYEVQSSCYRCGETEEQNKEHNWVDANCSTPKTCSTCGKTDGEALGHIPNEDDGNCTTAIICEDCGKVTTAGKTNHTPNADDGDCTTAITCKDCGKVTTAGKMNHTPNADDGNCTTAIKCLVCGKTAVAGATDHIDANHDNLCDNPGCQITVGNPTKDENDGIDLPIVPNN